MVPSADMHIGQDTDLIDMRMGEDVDIISPTPEDMGPREPDFGDPLPLPEREACDDSLPPVVLAHGFLGSGDTWGHHIQRFAANGHCAERYHAFDWNSTNRESDHVAALESFISDVRRIHDVEQVDLIGHSAGGGLGFEYLADAQRAETIRRYVHVGSFPADGPPGSPDNPTPTLNLWSAADTVVEGMDIPDATNVQLMDDDHYEVATSPASFQAIYQFLSDREPATLQATQQDPSVIAGMAQTFAENQPESGGTVNVWGLNTSTGLRETARRQFRVGEDGRWGPMVVSSSEAFEFEALPEDTNAPRVRYFREPFLADDYHVYLRTFPGPGSLASILVSLLPTDENSVALVVFNSSGAFIEGRDSLTLNGQELLDENSAPASNTSIALFVYDLDQDGEAGGTSPLFDMFPFLAAIDVPMEPDPTDTMTLDFNGRVIRLPRAPASDGILIAVFQ